MPPVILALISALLFGAAAPACKALLRDIHPVQLAGLLYLGAAVGVSPAIVRAGGWTPFGRLDRRNALRLGGAVLFGGILGPVALLLGLRLASAASVSLWLNFELVATALLGVFIFRDHLGKVGWAAVVGVVSAGAILTVGEGASGAAAASLVALACLFWGLDNHLTALIDGITPAQSTFWKGLSAGGFNCALAFFMGATVPPPVSAGGGLLVGALAYGASIALYITAAQQMGATRAQLVFASAPFFGAALSATALGESLEITHFVAAVILIASLGMMFRDQHAHLHMHEALEHEHSHRHDDEHHLHEHAGMRASHRHTHRHRHDRTIHHHPHWPDLHHRHRHDDEKAGGEAN